MDQDGGGFGQDQTVVLQHRNLVERADCRELRAIGVAGQIIPGADLIRQTHLLQRPLDAHVLGLADPAGEHVAEGVQGDHGAPDLFDRRPVGTQPFGV